MHHGDHKGKMPGGTSPRRIAQNVYVPHIQGGPCEKVTMQWVRLCRCIVGTGSILQNCAASETMKL